MLKFGAVALACAPSSGNGCKRWITCPSIIMFVQLLVDMGRIQDLDRFNLCLVRFVGHDGLHRHSVVGSVVAEVLNGAVGGVVRKG